MIKSLFMRISSPAVLLSLLLSGCGEPRRGVGIVEKKPHVLLVVIGLIVTGWILAYLVWRFSDRSRRVQPSPFDIAGRRLKRLERAGFPGENECAAWYDELWETLRSYVAESYGLTARELVSGDFYCNRGGHELISGKSCLRLKRIMEICERVGLSGYRPSMDESFATMETVKRFMEETKP